jgi:hypothetical protein
MFAVFVLLLSSFASAACDDTDGGKTYYVKGRCTAENGYPGYDECWDWQIVRERYCMDNGNCWFYDYPCRYLCEEGKCIPNPLEWLIPVRIADGVWVANPEAGNNDIPPCLGEIQVGSNLKLVSENWQEYSAKVTLGPVFYDPKWMNTWRIELEATDYISNTTIATNQFWLSIVCKDLTLRCIERPMLWNPAKPEEDMMPGFAFGNSSGEIARFNNECKDGNLTRFFCEDDYNVAFQKVECEHGCVGSHCAAEFNCFDSDLGKNFTAGGNVTITRRDQFEQDFVQKYEDECTEGVLKEMFCSGVKLNFTTRNCEFGCKSDSACASSEAEVLNTTTTTTIPPLPPAGIEDSGCCLNPNRDACTYYDRAENCCLEWDDEYTIEEGPGNQEECLASWFFVYDSNEACSVMGEAGSEFENANYCTFGCCCERTAIGDVLASQAKQIECLWDNKAWAPFNEIINCDQASCYAMLDSNGGGNDDGSTSGDDDVDLIEPPLPDVSKKEETVCANKRFKLCLDIKDPAGGKYNYQASNIPKEADYDQGLACVAWTPTFNDIGWHTMSFEDTEKNKRVQAAIKVETCCPMLDPIEDQDACVGEALEICASAQPDEGRMVFSALTMPGGATFTPLSGCLDWTPAKSQTGANTVQFSVSNGQCGDSKFITIQVEDCSASVSEVGGGIDWGLVVGIVVAVLAVIAALLSWIAWPVALIIAAVSTAIGSMVSLIF